jgi:hypothetical protein
VKEVRVESLELPKFEGLKSIIAIDLKGGNASIDRGDMGVHAKGGKWSLIHILPRKKEDIYHLLIKRQCLRS